MHELRPDSVCWQLPGWRVWRCSSGNTSCDVESYAGCSKVQGSGGDTARPAVVGQWQLCMLYELQEATWELERPWHSAAASPYLDPGQPQAPKVTMQELDCVHSLCSGALAACAGGPGGLWSADGPRAATAHAAAGEDFADCDGHCTAFHSRQEVFSGAVVHGCEMMQALLPAVACKTQFVLEICRSYLQELFNVLHAICCTTSFNSVDIAKTCFAVVLCKSAQATTALGQCQSHNGQHNFVGCPDRQSCSE